ncbi:MAG TPA: EVE domain-containing protein [Phycisphaerales bacterium]|nr:EVE domain-containing protein [Phycisphaerales bacterium]
MATYLLKTEPSCYSFGQLEREKRCRWDGVVNPQARIAVRAMTKGDEAFIYHTGDEKAIVGLARVLGKAYEDPEETGLNERGEPRAPVVDLEVVRAAKTPVTLASLREDPRFEGFVLLKNSRLSAMPVPPALDRALRTMAGL